MGLDRVSHVGMQIQIPDPALDGRPKHSRMGTQHETAWTATPTHHCIGQRNLPEQHACMYVVYVLCTRLIACLLIYTKAAFCLPKAQSETPSDMNKCAHHPRVRPELEFCSWPYS